MGVVSLIFGIVSIVLSFFGPFSWIGIILGVVGIILGAISRKKTQSGVATAGMVLSIIGTVLCAILYLACVACVAAASVA